MIKAHWHKKSITGAQGGTYMLQNIWLLEHGQKLLKHGVYKMQENA